MPVMKAQQAAKSRESAIVLDLSDLEREAGLIVSRARAQAAAIVAEARADAAREALRVREEARVAGQAEGRKNGLVEGRQQGHDEALAATQKVLMELQSRWGQMLELLRQHMPVHVADARTDLIKLALAIAEKVTRQEGLRNRAIAPSLVEETLRMIGTARLVSIHAGAVEMDLLQQYLPDLKRKFGSIESMELVIDESVGPGGCELRGAGIIDARLETQLRWIAEEILGEVGGI